jgi:hypothetical protein
MPGRVGVMWFGGVGGVDLNVKTCLTRLKYVCDYNVIDHLRMQIKYAFGVVF